MREILLALVVFLFLVTGGFIDYWQAAQEHKKPLPKFLKDYFGIFWLGLYTGLWPLLLVFVASGFDFHLEKLALAIFLLGTVAWELVYSYLDTGKLISPQPGYFYLRGKNYAFSTKKISLLHIIRVLGAIILILL